MPVSRSFRVLCGQARETTRGLVELVDRITLTQEYSSQEKTKSLIPGRGAAGKEEPCALMERVRALQLPDWSLGSCFNSSANSQVGCLRENLQDTA